MANLRDSVHRRLSGLIRLATDGLSNDVVVAPAARDDPYKGFNFRVEIEGASLAAFSEVAGLESETAVIEYRVGGETNTVRKLPGLTKYASIVLRRGITHDAELWNWRKNIANEVAIETIAITHEGLELG